LENNRRFNYRFSPRESPAFAGRKQVVNNLTGLKFLNGVKLNNLQILQIPVSAEKNFYVKFFFHF